LVARDLRQLGREHSKLFLPGRDVVRVLRRSHRWRDGEDCGEEDCMWESQCHPQALDAAKPSCKAATASKTRDGGKSQSSGPNAVIRPESAFGSTLGSTLGINPAAP